VNGFRYRVEQALADVRPRDIRHARAHANAQELANSEILMVCLTHLTSSLFKL
jgi:hypothetical protein